MAYSTITRNTTADPYNGMMLNKNDKDLLSNYLRYLSHTNIQVLLPQIELS